ncbi:hypothetical protein [Haloarcula pellucida]|uniref:DUF7998 domain-containing protein n=1 Tax=Haloarcula pellucida TaxID=1427151 RepID=A0A830GNB8_9EURY|nr:hypothetical protein [Halomicroarcula pellucida]MBX0347969.1 hypothetical protein [Halomicroarcula pellucida]GGN96274.1 hypothetical protein GCM10009030_24420 [Halomicroarcula pellucida]
MSLLSGIRGGDDTGFDDYDAFVPEHVPDPGEVLEGHDVLTDADHAAFHRVTMGLFAERGVYDMTFGYNLARLNLDHRHPDAGFRYAREADDPAVLRAEFTPTTEFCPQSDTLTVGAFRAWNGLTERHEYDLVRVRVDSMHHQSVAINGKLQQLEATYRETGEIPDDPGSADDGDDLPDETDVETPF